ncbi:MAG: glycerol-3-phosphate dehydrogenase/oxidase [Pirellulales bacterium]|nr:glycerol-3-phosphate dehydrogenase/oxidase [Pirellulales bacterium]
MAAASPVVVLGGGINGAAVARELAVCGLSVWVVESQDICFGTTAYSSRLIHGGLRYLEYGDVSLVRESLTERTRLLRLAPQYVRPLELLVPVSQRLGGWRQGLCRLAGREPAQVAPRGLWAVRAGLFAYDLLAAGSSLPPHRLLARHERARLNLHPRYKWVCSFYDAQVPFPERLVLALLHDAQQAARQQGSDFRLYTYSDVRRVGKLLHIQSRHGSPPSVEIEPRAVVNATGPWVDAVLAQLEVPAQPLLAGTKGSHLLTYHPLLRAALGKRGLYVEAPDGRPVFILPFGEATLVGTTDEPYTGDPAEARATQPELEYLIDSVNRVLPSLQLSLDDIDLHYCGVRPLQRSGRSTPAARSRRHAIEEHCGMPWPLVSLVGGKLTTCRQLAAEAADRLLARFDLSRSHGTSDRLVPGAEDYPPDEEALLAACDRLASQHGLQPEQVRLVWPLYGTRTESVLAAALGSGAGHAAPPTRAAPAEGQDAGTAASSSGTANLQAGGHVDSLTAGQGSPDALASMANRASGVQSGSLAPAKPRSSCLAATNWPVAVVRWIIEHEWVWTINDLVERRLTLLYDRGLSQATLAQLASLLVEAGRLAPHDATRHVEAARQRLVEHFGKRLAP